MPLSLLWICVWAFAQFPVRISLTHPTHKQRINTKSKWCASYRIGAALHAPPYRHSYALQFDDMCVIIHFHFLDPQYPLPSNYALAISPYSSWSASDRGTRTMTIASLLMSVQGLSGHTVHQRHQNTFKRYLFAMRTEREGAAAVQQ